MTLELMIHFKDSIRRHISRLPRSVLDGIETYGCLGDSTYPLVIITTLPFNRSHLSSRHARHSITLLGIGLPLLCCDYDTY